MEVSDEGPRGNDGMVLGSVNDDFDIVIPFPLEDTENEYHEVAYRLSEQDIVHPNGRGAVEKRVLQASLIQELRAMNLIVKLVKNRAGNILFLLVRGPTLTEWAQKTWIPIEAAESDIEAHIPNARPRIFAEKAINCERDERLAKMRVPLIDTKAQETAMQGKKVHEVEVLMSFYDYWADKLKTKYLCRSYEVGFDNFYLPYEFNSKHLYCYEGEHNLAYEGPLVSVDELEKEMENGTYAAVATQIINGMKASGEYAEIPPPGRRRKTHYVVDPNQLAPKAWWDFHGESTDTEMKLQLEQQVAAHEDNNEQRRRMGRENLPLPPGLLNIKIRHTQYEMYLRHFAKHGFMGDEVSRSPLSHRSWMENKIIRNRMRASFLRSDITLIAIQESCKPFLTRSARGDKGAMPSGTGVAMSKAPTSAEGKPLNPWEATPSSFGNTVDIELSQLESLGVVMSPLPIHDVYAVRWLKEFWASLPMKQILLSYNFWMGRYPLDEVRDYFGEEVGFYFAFLGAYTRALIVPGLFGAIVEIASLASEEGRLLNDSAPVPFYCIFLSLWAISFLQYWVRHEAALAHRWGVSDLETQERVRPQFKGEEERDVYTEQITLVRKKGQAWEVGGNIFAAACLTGVIMYNISILVYQKNIMVMLGDPTDSTAAYIWYNASIGALSGLGMAVFDVSFTLLAQWLTERENQRTFSQHESSLTSKLVVFYLITSNSSLFYLAFNGSPCQPTSLEDFSAITSYCTGERSVAYNTPYVVPDLVSPFDYARGNVSFTYDAFSTWVNETDGVVHTVANIKNPCYKNAAGFDSYCQLGTSMHNLGVQLALIFTSKSLINKFLELFLPYSTLAIAGYSEQATLARQGFELKKSRQANRILLTGAAAEESEVGKQFKRSDMYIMYDHIKLVTQFGYVTLFAASFPLAPLMALINNLLQARVDIFKDLILLRRPRPTQAGGIGIFKSMLTFIAFSAVLTNALLLGITSSSLANFLTSSGFQLGAQTKGVWRWNRCSPDARFNTTGEEVRLTAGVCLPLGNLRINADNGFTPGERPYEQQYTLLWAMIVIEHAVVIIMFVLDKTVPDVSKKILSERRGQRQWLERRAARRAIQTEQAGNLTNYNEQRGRFAMRLLDQILGSEEVIRAEMKAAKFESEFHPETGMPKESLRRR
eukprot:CAMPEP_0113674588 /NCGR_PEP_ID=MMETSP0038_2-20120614/7508_1 /TAXON_ID=2898 /ORGANISM="Cryptomonas paramecium" /LENGTH=1162 /DNA_ID=CAMNT_0000591197 /DNA_START=7 /DNA_END=3492 /DNA_ORIENTATION=+ /assembly_acc=CAM_ASM_000170